MGISIEAHCRRTLRGNVLWILYIKSKPRVSAFHQKIARVESFDKHRIKTSFTLLPSAKCSQKIDGCFQLARNTSAPHLDTEFDKENARRSGGLDCSPETLKKLLGGATRLSPTTRPTVIRKPYDQPRAPEVIRSEHPIRIPITPFRQLNQNVDTDYAAAALQHAREQRSASHAVDPNTPLTPDRSFDEKERIFARNTAARQVGGV
jgi:hypothetical protein